MFGWRKRIGYICPAVLEISVYDFYLVAPEGVGLVAVTNPIEAWRDDEYERSHQTIVQAVEQLTSRQVDFIHHAGAPPVVSQGPDFMRRLIRQMEELSGLPASTAVYSAIQALRSLDAERIVVVTPFPADLHDRLVSFVASEGFTIEAESRLESDFKTLHQISQRDAYDFVTRAIKRAPGAKAAYVPCPQWHVFEMTRYLEAEVGMPLVTSDSGDFWYAFRRLGVRDVRPGYGALLDRLRETKERDLERVS